MSVPHAEPSCPSCGRALNVGQPQSTPDWTKRGLATGAVVGVGVVIAAPMILGALGFGAAGVIAGGWAAGVQGAAVAAGGPFAVAQGIAAAGGLGILPAAGVVAAGGGLGAAAGAVADITSPVCGTCGRPLLKAKL